MANDYICLKTSNNVFERDISITQFNYNVCNYA